MENKNKYSYICYSLYVPEDNKEYEALVRVLACYPRRKTLFIKKLVDNFLKERGITDVSQCSDTLLKKMIKEELDNKSSVPPLPYHNQKSDDLATFLSMILNNQSIPWKPSEQGKNEPKEEKRNPEKPKRTNLFQKRSPEPQEDTREDKEGIDPLQDKTLPTLEPMVQEEMLSDEEEDADTDTSGLLDNWEEGLDIFS